ncbi:MAG TPA: GNAT family N-acetyltransferase [Candidatus Luteococcus avicola]|nr:GNAT family N-acetyltransferase [Candidatus Luteococcus avicola]
MADEVEVRRATADDVDVLVELRAEMFRSMGSAGVDGPWQQASRQWFAERLDHADYGIFVVTAAGQVVASAVGSARDCAPSPSVPEGRDVLISTVCTFPEWRGRGHGRRAFDAVLDWARSTGIRRAELMATPDGRPMYEKAGFTLTACPAMRTSL